MPNTALARKTQIRLPAPPKKKRTQEGAGGVCNFVMGKGGTGGGVAQNTEQANPRTMCAVTLHRLKT